MSRMIVVVVLGIARAVEIGVCIRDSNAKIVETHHFIVFYGKVPEEGRFVSSPVTDRWGTLHEHGISEDVIFTYGQPIEQVRDKLNLILMNNPSSFLVVNDHERYEALHLNKQEADLEISHELITAQSSTKPCIYHDSPHTERPQTWQCAMKKAYDYGLSKWLDNVSKEDITL